MSPKNTSLKLNGKKMQGKYILRNQLNISFMK